VRHSLAFWLHSLGVPPADAAALLGHTVDVHLSVYLPESGSSGIARAASALGMSGQQAAAEYYPTAAACERLCERQQREDPPG